MNIFDTHTHLFSEQFENESHEVIENAINSGVKKMLLPGINASYIKKQIELAEKYPKNIRIAIGLHPSDVKENYNEELQIVKKHIDNKFCIAIGEIGIDLYWDKTYLETQKKAFEYQLLLAKEKKLPIIIHARESFDEIFEIVEKHNDENLFGVFHSFTGNFEQAQRIIDFGGFKIGINGIVTFKNSGLDAVVKQIPKEYIVLETDSPYLSPTPKRGKRNESTHLIYIAQKIADIYEVSIEEIQKITNKNANELFGF